MWRDVLFPHSTMAPPDHTVILCQILMAMSPKFSGSGCWGCSSISVIFSCGPKCNTAPGHLNLRNLWADGRNEYIYFPALGHFAVLFFYFIYAIRKYIDIMQGKRGAIETNIKNDRFPRITYKFKTLVVCLNLKLQPYGPWEL